MMKEQMFANGGDSMNKKIEELYHRLQYFEKIGVVRLQRGEQMEFPCPQCGGTAHAVRIASTNQLGAWYGCCGNLVSRPERLNKPTI